MTAVISRRKLLRSRLATGPGPAWKYLYDVSLDGREVVHGAEMLSIATRMAREAAAPHRPTIIRQWLIIPSAPEAK